MAIQLPDRRTLSQAVRDAFSDECACDRYKPEQTCDFHRELCSRAGKSYADAEELATELHAMLNALHPTSGEQRCLLYILLIRVVSELFEGVSSHVHQEILKKLDAGAMLYWPSAQVHTQV